MEALFLFWRIFISLLVKLIVFFNFFILVYFFLINTIYFAQLLFSRLGVLRQSIRGRMLDYYGLVESPFTLPITVVMPAHNEEADIVESLKALTQLNYPQYEILVVNDGSTDNTLPLLIEHFSLERTDIIIRRPKPEYDILRHETIKGLYRSTTNSEHFQITVLDKAQGGKADALNAGILVSKYPLVCTVDADTLLERQALIRVVHPFMEDPLRLAASGGIVRIVNGCKVENGIVRDTRLPKEGLVVFQIVEYLRAFLASRYALGQINALLIISGSFTLFRKDIAIKTGGYNKNSIVEDMELIFDFHKYLAANRKPYKINFVPSPIAWTEAPTSLRALGRQRIRWHRGLGEILLGNLRMLFNPAYGFLGMIIMPYYFFFEFLGPSVELLGYILVPLALYLGIIEWGVFWLFIGLAFVYGTFLSLFALLLHELSERRYYYFRDIVRLVIYAFLENILFRPLMSVIRTYSLLTFWTKKHWFIERRGFISERE